MDAEPVQEARKTIARAGADLHGAVGKALRALVAPDSPVVLVSREEWERLRGVVPALDLDAVCTCKHPRREHYGYMNPVPEQCGHGWSDDGRGTGRTGCRCETFLEARDGRR